MKDSNWKVGLVTTHQQHTCNLILKTINIPGEGVLPYSLGGGVLLGP